MSSCPKLRAARLAKIYQIWPAGDLSAGLFAFYTPGEKALSLRRWSL